MKAKESISIRRSPEEIWRFWLPVSTDAQWRGGITSAEWTTPPPHGVGSTGVHHAKGLGAIPWRITAWEDGRTFQFVHTGGPMRGTMASYRVEPEAGGSRVTLQADFRGPLLMRILLPFLRRMLAKGLGADLRTLKKVMEEQQAPGS